MHFKSLFVLASFVISSFAETAIAQVQDDITNKMASAVIDFSTAVHAFPVWGGTVGQAMAIHYSASTLNSVIANTTNDMNSITSQFSDADCQKILSHLQTLEPGFLQSLTGIASRKLALEVLPLGNVPALVKQDLAIMRTSADNFMNAFIAHASPSILVPARTMKLVVDYTFATVIVMFNI